MFLFLSVFLLGFEISAYYKGWHFGAPDLKGLFNMVYGKWVLIRVGYIAPPLQLLANSCIYLFLIHSLDRLVLCLRCFWIKYNKIKPILSNMESFLIMMMLNLGMDFMGMGFVLWFLFRFPCVIKRRLGAVMCMGVTAGAYILTLFAIKYTRRVLGLILVSPLCKAPSWTEWLCNKVMANVLYYYGMCGLIKELLLIRYFSKEVRGGAIIPETELVHSCRRLLGERQGSDVLNFLEAINGRPDITEGLKRLQCRSLIFVGENSPFNSESLHMTSKLDRRFSALVEVQGCGSIVTEEQPDAMLIPLEYFLMGYGFYRPSQMNVSPRSPLSPTSISPELYTPESMGLKLKPIKTRLSQKF